MMDGMDGMNGGVWDGWRCMSQKGGWVDREENMKQGQGQGLQVVSLNVNKGQGQGEGLQFCE